MAADGRTVVFITHKLDEVMAVADRITVLRAGRRVATTERDDTDKQSLANLMVGHEVSVRSERGEAGSARACLSVRGLNATGDRGLQVLHDVDFEVRSGEILGLAGVSGNGQRELTEVLAGIRSQTSGAVEMDGVDIGAKTPAERIALGLAFVPEDRLGMGLVGSMDCVGNILLKRSGDDDLRRGPFVDKGQAEKLTQRLVDSFAVKTPSIRAPVRLLSGGNIQKLLLARELSSRPKLLIASQPTAGLDVAGARAVHELLLEERARGVAILLVSEDLDELLSLADRILVLYEGRVMGTVAGAGAERSRLGLMMAGSGSESQGGGE